eukprot:TRINITY_DN6441_c0_g1_i1.p1 TRINITY_DN6441_c0_g1~~TRINITY_DN6441_c0_g1_i1.p1  ORF type:complete len:222 (-),score=50.88 TRINITY_DN6441_c0_g1_i1:48-626(-)
MRLDNEASKLKELQKSNVLNDTFFIYYDGHFGTINGYRLGRLPSIPVTWEEINAAWGQTVLLLNVMVKSCNFTFSKYELSPMGSFSKIKVLSGDSFLQLFGSANINLGEMYWFQRFNTAMCAFAECIAEFAIFAEKEDRTFKLQYPMESDSIGGMPIKLQKDEELWTRCMKFMLTNLKCLLVFVSKQQLKER